MDRYPKCGVFGQGANIHGRPFVCFNVELVDSVQAVGPDRLDSIFRGVSRRPDIRPVLLMTGVQDLVPSGWAFSFAYSLIRKAGVFCRPNSVAKSPDVFQVLWTHQTAANPYIPGTTVSPRGDILGEQERYRSPDFSRSYGSVRFQRPRMQRVTYSCGGTQVPFLLVDAVSEIPFDAAVKVLVRAIEQGCFGIAVCKDDPSKQHEAYLVQVASETLDIEAGEEVTKSGSRISLA